MNQTIEQIKPETIARIESQAKLAGLSIDDYLQSLIPKTNGHKSSPKKRLTSEERAKRFLDWANSHDPNIPAIPLESLRRENLY